MYGTYYLIQKQPIYLIIFSARVLCEGQEETYMMGLRIYIKKKIFLYSTDSFHLSGIMTNQNKGFYCIIDRLQSDQSKQSVTSVISYGTDYLSTGYIYSNINGIQRKQKPTYINILYIIWIE